MNLHSKTQSPSPQSQWTAIRAVAVSTADAKLPGVHDWRCLVLLMVASAMVMTVKAEEIPITDIQRDKRVDFATEIFPLLKQNCLACHHEKESEGGLNLESHQSLIQGGDSGAAVVAKQSDQSLILLRASGVEGDLMPPEDNSVGAKALTPEQLGLIKRWIAEGAVGGSVPQEQEIQWQPIPESVRTIYSVDVSPDGQFVAAGHGNRVAVYDMTTAAEVARLVDPSLESISGPGVADVDLIQSIAFSPTGDRIATGGFRTVRIWRKSTVPVTPDQSPLALAVGPVALHPDGKRAAMVNAIGDIEIWDLAERKQLQTLRGHSDVLVAINWAQDRLVSADRSGLVNIYNGVDGRLLVAHETSTALKTIATLADGSMIAAVDLLGKARVWRVDEDEKQVITVTDADLAALTAVTDANSLVFLSKPKPQLVVGTESAGVLVVDAVDGKLIRKIDHGGPVTSVAADPSETQIATAGRDGAIKVWQAADGKAIRTLRGTPESRLLIAAAQRDFNRQKASVARLTTKTDVLTKAVAKEEEVVKKITEQRDKATTALGEQGKKHADAVAKVAATQAAIQTANEQTTKSQKVTEAATKAMADAMAMAEKLGKEVATQTAEIEKANQDAQTAQQQVAAAEKALAEAKAMADKLMKEVETKKAAITKAKETIEKSKVEIETAKKTIDAAKMTVEKSTKELEGQKKAVTTADEEKVKAEKEVAKRVQALAAATAAKSRAAAAIPRHQVVLASASRRSLTLQKQLDDVQAKSSTADVAVVSIAYGRPDGDVLISTHADGSTVVYRVSDGTALTSFSSEVSPASPGFPAGAVVTPNGQLCSYSQRGQAVVWPLQPTWRLERTIGTPSESPISDRVTALDFRSDGLSIAVGSGPPSRSGDVKIFSVDTGKLVRDFGDVHSDTVLGVRFSPDGNWIASSAADKTVRVLDVAQGATVRTFEGHTHHVLAVDWQDDVQTLASASADQTVKVWNAQTGEQRKTISGFGKEITAITFVQQTSQVVTACADGQLRLHNAPDGKSLRSFNASGDFLYTVDVTDDGKTLVAGGQDGVLRIWNVADAKLLHEIK
ncbi:MAG: hypothetical protein HKN47_26655 [Pirellulaceae bacterium]|nr:hypothetical protein [Pirellulaceae bacterium]